MRLYLISNEVSVCRGPTLRRRCTEYATYEQAILTYYTNDTTLPELKLRIPGLSFFFGKHEPSW